eukprot:6189767-Pleurochrysis_carterae.AAC.2
MPGPSARPCLGLSPVPWPFARPSLKSTLSATPPLRTALATIARACSCSIAAAAGRRRERLQLRRRQ